MERQLNGYSTVQVASDAMGKQAHVRDVPVIDVAARSTARKRRRRAVPLRHRVHRSFSFPPRESNASCPGTTASG